LKSRPAQAWPLPVLLAAPLAASVAALLAASVAALLAAGCDQQPSASTSAPVSAAAAEPTTSSPVSSAATAQRSGAKPAAELTVAVPPGGRMEDRVNAVFHVYTDTNLPALVAEQRKLMTDQGLTLDSEQQASGYHVFEVSRAGASTKVSLACTPEKRECFVSVQKQPMQKQPVQN
jgi:hypothetical protein